MISKLLKFVSATMILAVKELRTSAILFLILKMHSTYC